MHVLCGKTDQDDVKQHVRKMTKKSRSVRITIPHYLVIEYGLVSRAGIEWRTAKDSGTNSRHIRMIMNDGSDKRLQQVGNTLFALVPQSILAEANYPEDQWIYFKRENDPKRVSFKLLRTTRPAVPVAVKRSWRQDEHTKSLQKKADMWRERAMTFRAMYRNVKTKYVRLVHGYTMTFDDDGWGSSPSDLPVPDRSKPSIDCSESGLGFGSMEIVGSDPAPEGTTSSMFDPLAGKEQTAREPMERESIKPRIQTDEQCDPKLEEAVRKMVCSDTTGRSSAEPLPGEPTKKRRRGHDPRSSRNFRKKKSKADKPVRTGSFIDLSNIKDNINRMRLRGVDLSRLDEPESGPEPESGLEHYEHDKRRGIIDESGEYVPLEHFRKDTGVYDRDWFIDGTRFFEASIMRSISIPRYIDRFGERWFENPYFIAYWFRFHPVMDFEEYTKSIDRWMRTLLLEFNLDDEDTDEEYAGALRSILESVRDGAFFEDAFKKTSYLINVER